MPSNERLLEGNVALITGGSRGIGKAIGVEFAKQGVQRIYFVSRGETPAKTQEALQSQTDLQALGTEAIWIKADISKNEGIDAILDKIQNDRMNVDTFVSNAGYTFNALAEMNTPDLLDASYNLNLRAPVLLAQGLKARGLFAPDASSIFIASIIGPNPNTGQINYATMKAGTIAAAQVLAMEWGPERMRVNSIMPGFVPTELTAEIPAGVLPMLKDMTPKDNRLASVEDVAKVALFLASDLSSFVNGASIPVDGGLAGMAGAGFILQDAGYRRLTNPQKRQLGIS